MMTEKTFADQCTDITQSFTIEIPCELAERIEMYAIKKGSTVTGVLIEVLDRFFL